VASERKKAEGPDSNEIFKEIFKQIREIISQIEEGDFKTYKNI
jgi:hypothetical protein